MTKSAEQRLYVSTSCFPTPYFDEILELCDRHAIDGLELSAVRRYDPTALLGSRRYLVHNYFPPPADGFVINLAATRPELVQQSREFCRNAIDLSRRLRGPVYAAHAGFTADISPDDLGRPERQARLPLADFADPETAYEALRESAVQLTAYADAAGVRFLIENHVLSPLAGEAGARLLPVIDAEGLCRLAREVNHPAFGILLDLGHLNVTATACGFDRDRFIDTVAPYVAALHLSENNGIVDGHLPITEQTWFLPRLREFKQMPVTIELERGGMDEIHRSREVLLKWL